MTNTPHANTHVYDVQVTSRGYDNQTLTGVFKFDGRLKFGQAADFSYVLDPAQSSTSKPAWHVTLHRDSFRDTPSGTERRRTYIRREMKACGQKDEITRQLKVLLDDLRDEPPVKPAGGCITPEPDTVSIRNLSKENVATSQAATDDLLEIPDSLKR